MTTTTIPHTAQSTRQLQLAAQLAADEFDPAINPRAYHVALRNVMRLVVEDDKAREDLKYLRQAVTDWARNTGARNPERFADTLIKHRREDAQEATHAAP